MAASLLRGPALYNLGNDQVLIWWETDTPESPNSLEWWKAGMPSRTSVTPVSTSVGVPDTQNDRHLHYAELSGLTANTLHYYVIKAPDFESPIKLFTTYRDDGQSVKLGLWGSNEDQVASTVPGFAATLDFLDGKGVGGYLGTGGYVGSGSLYRDWEQHWLDVIGSRLASKGFSGCRGDSDGFSALSRAMLPFRSPDPSYFAVSIGKSRIVGLTSLAGAPRLALRPGGGQYEWLLHRAVQDPAWKDALYRIVLVHHPFRTTFWTVDCAYGVDGTEEDLREYLLPLLKRSGADLVVHGASHSYQRGAYVSTHPNSPHTVHHLVSGGGGAFRHDHRCWEWLPPEEPGILFDTSDYVALTLDFSSARLLVEAHGLSSGDVVDRVTISPHKLF